MFHSVYTGKESCGKAVDVEWVVEGSILVAHVWCD